MLGPAGPRPRPHALDDALDSPDRDKSAGESLKQVKSVLGKNSSTKACQVRRA